MAGISGLFINFPGFWTRTHEWAYQFPGFGTLTHEWADVEPQNPPGERTLVRCTGDTGCCLSGKIASGKYTNLLVNYVSLVANELIVADPNDTVLCIRY